MKSLDASANYYRCQQNSNVTRLYELQINSLSTKSRTTNYYT